MAGSEMNITSNPRSSELAGCDEQGMQGNTMRANSTVSRTSQRSRGHLPPPGKSPCTLTPEEPILELILSGHPAYGSPHFQENAEAIRFDPYQKSHRFHQQLLMHRPHRFLPAPPVHQSLSPVYQNSRKILEELERMQYSNLRDDAVFERDQDELRHGLDASRNIIQNPMASEDFSMDPDPTEDLQQRKRIPIDSSTYTKKNQGLLHGGERDRGRLILPVGYPFMVKDDSDTVEDCNEISPGKTDEIYF